MGKILAYLLLAVNAFLVGMLVLCAYSPYLHPQVYPVASCLGLAFPIFLVLNLLFLLFWLFVKWRYALLTIVGLLVCYLSLRSYLPLNFSGREVPEGSIKLLSYNVMGFDGMKKSEGTNPVLTYLAGSGADIICMQEYCTSTRKDLLTAQDVRNALKAYPYYSVQSYGGQSVQLACYSKFPILSVKPVPYKSATNGSVAYTLKVGGDTLLLVNNHLESNKLTREDRGLYEDMIDNPNAEKVKSGLHLFLEKLGTADSIRSAQADSVAKLVAASPYPDVVVCGDFNDVSISYAHRVLTEHLRDAFTETGCGLGISYNQNKFFFRIDHILLSPSLKAARCTVDDTIRESDHYPIWCYIYK